MLLMTVSLAACSDDDGPVSATCEEEYDAETINESNYENVCMKLLEEKVEGNDTSYIVANATPDITGHIYSVNVADMGEAERFFESFCVPTDSNFVVKTEGTKKISDFGALGRIEFVPVVGDDGHFATINVRLERLDVPATIRLIVGDGNAQSPYEIGDIIKYNGKVWLCTVEYGGGGQLGRLMRFGNTSASYSVGDHYKKVYFPNGYADATAVNGFFELMQTASRHAELRKAVIAEFLKNGEKYGAENYRMFRCFDPNVPWPSRFYPACVYAERHNTKYHWKCARHLKKLYVDYFGFTPLFNRFQLYKGQYDCYHEYNGPSITINLQTEQVTFGYDELQGAERLWPNY